MTTRSEARGQRPQDRPEARGRRPEERPSHRSPVTLTELQEWGEDFGRRLSPPAIVTLEGDLGSGKTTLAQAICRGVGIVEDVTSPTFSLVNEYQVGDTTLYHLDLYRLRGSGDLTNVGWDDIINSGGIVLIEWPERAGVLLPDESIRIRLEHIPGDDTRRQLILV